MYPGVMRFDVTNGTNKEKRPMALATVKNSDNRNVPIFNVLLPSMSSWVFRWIFHDAIPKLLSKESLSNLRLILVDEDHHCNSQIDSARTLGILPNFQYRLCKWHKARSDRILKLQNLRNIPKHGCDRCCCVVCCCAGVLFDLGAVGSEGNDAVRRTRFPTCVLLRLLSPF